MTEVFLNIDDNVEAVDIVDRIDMTRYFVTRNSKYITVNFMNEEAKLPVQQKLLEIDCSYVVNLESANSRNLVAIILHWIQKEITIELKEFFKPYMDIIDLVCEKKRCHIRVWSN